jgi:WD40 repeat protein
LTALFASEARAAPPIKTAPAPLRLTQAWRLAHAPQLTQLKWSTDANAIVGCIDGRATGVWDPVSGALIRRVEQPKCDSTSITADGAHIGVAMPGGLQIIQVETGAQVARLPGVQSRWVLAHAPKTGAFAVHIDEYGSDARIEVWHPSAERPRYRLPVEHSVRALRFSKSGTHLTAVTEQVLSKKRERLKRPLVRTIRWTLPSQKIRSRRRGTLPPRWRRHDPSRLTKAVIERAKTKGYVAGWVRAPRGTRVLVQVRDAFEVYDRKGTAPPVRLQGLDHLGNRIMAMSPVSDRVAVGGMDGVVRIFRVGRPPQVLGDHGIYIKALAFSRNGKWLASGSHQGWTVWDLDTGAAIHRGEGSVESIAFDGASSALAVQTGGLTIWRTADWTQAKTLRMSAQVYEAPRGFLVARNDPIGDNPVQAPLLWLTAPEWTRHPLAPVRINDRCLSLLPDGRIAGTYIHRHSVSPGVRIWSLDAPDAVQRWRRDLTTSAVAAGPNGWIASLEWLDDTDENQISIWHPATGAAHTLSRLPTSRKGVDESLFFGNKGRGLAAMDNGGGVTYWTVESDSK